MSFQEVLDETKALRRVGPLAVRYETSLLVIEPLVRRGPPLVSLLFKGLAAAAGSAAVLLAAATSAVVLPTILAALCGGALGCAAFVDGRARELRVVLNFATEALRLERLPLGFRAGRTRVFRFDDATGVDVEKGEGLWLWLSLATGERVPLVEGLPDAEVEPLRQLWRLLRDALGLSKPAELFSPPSAE